MTQLTDTITISVVAATNTQFTIAIHVLAAIAHYETSYTSEILAGGVNANPVFVKRILVKLSKAKLVNATVGKLGGYTLARDPKNVSLLDIWRAVSPPSVFSIHAYEKKKWCVVSNHIKEVMGDVLVGSQKAFERDLKKTSLEDVVANLRRRAR